MFSLRGRDLSLFPIGQAVIAGIAGVLGSYGAAGATPAFVAAPISGFLARTLPPSLLTFAILVFGDLAQKLNLLLAVVLATGLLASASFAGLLVARHLGKNLLGAGIGAVLGWLIATVLTGAPVAAIGAGVGTGMVLTVGHLVSGYVGQFESVAAGRRALLGGLATAIGIGMIGVWLGQHRTEAANVTPEAEKDLQKAEEKSLDVDGLESLVSDRFYQVDINAVDPQLDESEWTLSLTGEVEEEATFTYDDLLEMPSERRFVTLRCVGDPLNGKQMDNALWTGVPVDRLLEQVGPTSACNCVMLRAADDYYEEFPLEALRGGLLAYRMNGKSLPRQHGFPLRALVPGHWGEVNVKWLTEIELLEKEELGFWEKRGWHGTGPVHTVAKLHAVNRISDGRVQVAGHAYAGTPGVREVRVSTDGGTTWETATLSEPLPGDDVWRQWKYEYDPPAREHEVTVYAIDGNGEGQTGRRSDPYPSGATGRVSRTISGTKR